MNRENDINIVGSSHVSEDSVEKIKEKIEQENPDVIAVELDEDRMDSLKNKDVDEDVTLDKLIKEDSMMEKMIVWGLTYYQNRIGQKTGVDPGSDMRAAIEEAEKRGKKLELIDRDFDVTLKRIIDSVKILEKLKMIAYALYMPFYLLINGMPDIEEELDDMDYSDHPEEEMVKEQINELRDFSPSIANVFLDERNKYMAMKIHRINQKGNSVLAVVGGAHKPGIKKELEKLEKNTSPNYNLEELSEIPSKRFNLSLSKTIGYGVSFLVAFLFVLLLIGGANGEVLMILVASWILINGIPVYLATRLLGAYRKSSLTGFGLAWMTSINPALAPGWFVGIIEIKNREDVSVNDLKVINEKISNPEGGWREVFKDLLEIPLFKVISIMAAANLASVAATAVFVIFVLPFLAVQFDLVTIISSGYEVFMRNIAGILY